MSAVLQMPPLQYSVWQMCHYKYMIYLAFEDNNAGICSECANTVAYYKEKLNEKDKLLL